MSGSKNAPARPGRSLALMLAIVVGGIATMFGTGVTTPKLAIDLAGGTSVTLTATSLSVEEGGKGGEIEADTMKQAVEIIRQRVNGFGVSEALVTTLGSENIVVSVPGQSNNRIVDQVGQTALLRFRPVMQKTVPTPLASDADAENATPAPTPRASDDEDADADQAETEDSGRVVSSALRAAADPSPEPTAPAAPAPRADTADFADIPEEVSLAFVRLDCTQAANRQGGDKAAAGAYVVACDREGTAKFLLGPAAVQGTELNEANAGLPSGASVGNWQIDMTFNGTGTRQFADLTAKLSKLSEPRNHLAITLDGVVMSDPVVNESIGNGEARISGDFDQAEAEALANVLKYGALPLAFEKSKIDTVSATLGADQLNGGLTAGMIGMICVVLYCLFYYRGLGVAALLGLGVVAVLAYTAVTLLGADGALNYRLSLAGVAGLIVAIGITADSFVVYFERVRDEIRDGRTTRAAVEHGWLRARRTILTANFVALLAAAVLYFFSVAEVKGFAFTLGIVTMIDVLVIFLFTKPLIAVMVRWRFFADGHPLSGVNRANLGIHHPVAAAPARPAGTKEA